MKIGVKKTRVPVLLGCKNHIMLRSLSRWTDSSGWKLTISKIYQTTRRHHVKKAVVLLVCVVQLVAALITVHGCCPSFRVCMAALIHLVKRSGFLSITVDRDQLMTWFPWVAWSVRADLLCCVKLDARRLLVNVRLVLDSNSILCSCNLTPNFFPVSPV